MYISQIAVFTYSTIVREFDLESCYYSHFWTNTHGKGMNPLITSSYRLNNTTALLQRCV